MQEGLNGGAHGLVCRRLHHSFPRAVRGRKHEGEERQLDVADPERRRLRATGEPKRGEGSWRFMELERSAVSSSFFKRSSLALTLAGPPLTPAETPLTTFSNQTPAKAEEREASATAMRPTLSARARVFDGGGGVRCVPGGIYLHLHSYAGRARPHLRLMSLSSPSELDSPSTTSATPTPRQRSEIHCSLAYCLLRRITLTMAVVTSLLW